MNTAQVDTKNLQELVRRFRVCWDVWPEYVVVGKETRQIGFELELSGTHEAGVEHAVPGCEHCQHVYAALCRIAEWILPKEERPSRYDMEPYEPSLRYSASRDFRPDVALTIRILHRTDGLAPVDACELRCLEEMKQRLREVGASQGSWTRRSAVA